MCTIGLVEGALWKLNLIAPWFEFQSFYDDKLTLVSGTIVSEVGL